MNSRAVALVGVAVVLVGLAGAFILTHRCGGIFGRDASVHLGGPVTYASPEVATARRAAQQALDAIVARDWATVYARSAVEVTSAVTRDQFIQTLENQTTPHVVSACVGGSGELTTAGGYTYWSQPIHLTVKNPNGTTSSFSSTIHLVLEQSQWRLIGTDPPQPS